MIDLNQKFSRNRNQTETRQLNFELEPEPKIVLNQNRHRNQTEIKKISQIITLPLTKKVRIGISFIHKFWCKIKL